MMRCRHRPRGPLHFQPRLIFRQPLHHLQPIARALLVGALTLAITFPIGVGRSPADALASPGQSLVTGSVVTGKASLNAVLIYTFVNCAPTPTSFNYAVALPSPLSQISGPPLAGSVSVPGISYAAIQIVVHVAHGTPPGMWNAPMNWIDVTSLDTGTATASVLTRPFDENSPTLHSSPNPRVLTTGPLGVTTFAGCIADSALAPARWRIIGEDFPFLYNTAVTNPAPGGVALVGVSNMSGTLPIPAGPPATITQILSPPFTLDPVVVNEVTIGMAAQTPSGTIPGVAMSRYTVLFFNPGPVPVESYRWSEIKRLFAP